MAGILKWIGRGVDELMKLGYPESVARRINSGELPMDEASRMARAREQGYDLTPQYSGYGTQDSVDLNNPDSFGEPMLNVDQQLWMSDNPLVANTYGTHPSGVVSPLLVKNPDDFENAGGRMWNNILGDDMYGYKTRDYIRDASKSGVDVAEIRNVVDLGRDTAKVMQLFPELAEKSASNVRVAINPTTARSLLSAAFDPEYTGPNILGSRVAPTVTTGVLGALILEEQRKKKEQAKSQVGGILGHLQSGKEMY